MSDESRIESIRGEGMSPDLATQLQELADRIESDPVTSWTADDLYAGLTRLSKVAEEKRRDVAVVRNGRPPTT